jgi:hypothetical protein
MKLKPSQDEIDRHFQLYQYANTYESAVKIHPIWTCGDDRPRSTKLFFFHLARAGGTTIRALLRAYSHVCKAAVATVARCETLDRAFMRGETWMRAPTGGRGPSSCILMKANNRSGGDIQNQYRISSEFLTQNEIDILAGRFPIGSDEYWNYKNTKKHVNIQYVVLLRDPLERYISQSLVDNANHNLTRINDAIAIIEATVKNRTKLGKYYEKYARTLITPEQYSWAQSEGLHWTSELRLNLTMANTINKGVIVGLLEDMPTTLEMLQYVLDAKGNADASIFRYYASDQIVSLNPNKSNMSRAVAARIRLDPKFSALIGQYLKYERRFYNFAAGLHKQQAAWIRDSGWKGFQSTDSQAL